MQHVSFHPPQRTHLLLAGWFTLLTLVGQAQFSQIQKITANPRQTDANFGNRVAIDGDVMVVAASQESGGGAAYVFEKSGTTWQQTARLVASDRAFADDFGRAVAISGNTIVVGAQLENEDANGGNTLGNAGSAYIFEKSGGTWSQTQKIVASDRGVDEYFGIAVGISGNTIVVGAIWEAQDASGGNTLAKAGAAYVFGKSGSTWSQTQKLVASDRSASDTFGYSVAVSGTTIVVGAIFDDQDASGGNALGDAGSVYVFDKSGSAWSQTQKLVASDRGATDEFGYSVGIAGSTIVVGAFWEDQDASGGNTLTNSGSVYVFEKGSTWSQTQKLVASDRGMLDQFGIFVGISGNTLVVGANYDAQNASGGSPLDYAGSAYVFEKGSTWRETQKLVASDRGQDDYFGISVGISGSTIVVGAFFEDQDASGGNTLSKAGSAYVFGTCDAATASAVTVGTSPICQGGSTNVSASYGGSATSGSFSDGGKGGAFSVSTSGKTVSGTYTPAASYSGLVTITFSTNDPDGTGGCAAATSTGSLTVNAAATATTPTLGASTICQGGSTSVSASFGGSATSGSFSDGGKGGAFSVSTSGSTVSGTYTPAASYSGTTTITFTTSDPDGPCVAATSTVNLTVNQAATASAVTVGTSPICQGGSTSVSASYGGSATSGSFSDGGKGGAFSVSTSGKTVSGTYTPAASYSGTTTITFTTNDPDGTGGCVAATSTGSLTVNAAATATTPTLGASTICQGGSTSVSASFGGSATSGSFSDGGKGGAFSVSTSGSTVSGTYTPAASYSGTTTITFTTSDPDGPCVAATSTVNLTVNQAATASTVTVGTSPICQGSSTSVSASFGGSASSGSFSDGKAGGTFSTISTNNKTVSATYTPAASYSGTTTITFTTNDPDESGPCAAATSTGSLTVNPAATATTPTLGASTICQGSSTSVSASFGGSATSGSFSDGGVGGAFSTISTNNKTVSATYTPAATYSGTTTITFTTNDPDEDGPCESATSTASLTVNPAATASAVTVGTSPICQGSSTSVSASFGGSATSGTFSDGEAGGSFNVTTTNGLVSGTYTPASGFSGSVTITFSTNDPDESGPCTAVTSTGSLMVNPAATASTPTLGAGAICQGSSTSVSASFGGSATSGSFSDGEAGGTFSNVSTNGGTVTATYTPATSYSGTVTITFSTNDPDGPCPVVSSTTSLTVNALPIVSLSALAVSYCQNASPSTPGTPGGGSYSIDGGSPVASFDPASLTTGSHSVVYTFTTAAACSASATASVTIIPPFFTQQPSVPANFVVCANRTVSISFNVNCPTNASFTAELSNSTGTFTTGTQSLGPVSPGVPNVLTIPALTSPSSANYRIRIVGSNPVLVSNLTGIFRINALEFNSTPTVSLTAVCVGSVVKVGFTVAGNCGFLPGNDFVAELHHASLSEPLNLGEVTPGLNNVVIPRSVGAGSGYRIRIRATAPGQESALSAAFTVNQPAFSGTPTVSLDNKCAGEAVRVSFTLTSCSFPSGNSFTAQLSDKVGSFGNPVNVGTVSPGGLNNVTIPTGTPAGTGYKIRVVSSNPEGISAVSGNFKVKACTNTREAAPEESGLRVVVSPNPSPEGRLRIAVSGAEGQALRVELFNGLGQSLREQGVQQAGEVVVLEWDISRQPQGLYLLRVSGEQEAKTVKILH